MTATVPHACPPICSKPSATTSARTLTSEWIRPASFTRIGSERGKCRSGVLWSPHYRPFERRLQRHPPPRLLRFARRLDDFQHVQRMFRGDEHVVAPRQTFCGLRGAHLPDEAVGLRGLAFRL